MANDTCNYPPNITDLFWWFNFVANNIAAPFYFVLAVSGHGLLLFAFAKQAKSDKPYMYQVYVACIKTAEALLRTVYYICMNAISYPNYRFHSFQEALVRSYAFMWYATRLGTVLPTACTTWALLMSVAMAADRVYSLLKPFAYKEMRHGRNRKIILLVCALVSFGASAFDSFRSNPIADGDGRYPATLNTEYTSRPSVKALAMLRIAIQATALIALTLLSLALCYLYRTRFVNAKAKMTSTADQKQTKEDERTLLLLTFIECSMTVVSVCITMGNYTLAYGLTQIYGCWRAMVTPVHDVSRMIIDVSNFYVIMIMSGKIRRMVKAAVSGYLPKNKVSSVQVIAPHGP